MPQIHWCIGTSGTPRLAIPMMARRVRAPAMALALVSVLARQTPTTWVPASAASSISARNQAPDSTKSAPRSEAQPQHRHPSTDPAAASQAVAPAEARSAGGNGEYLSN